MIHFSQNMSYLREECVVRCVFGGAAHSFLYQTSSLFLLKCKLFMREKEKNEPKSKFQPAPKTGQVVIRLNFAK